MYNIIRFNNTYNSIYGLIIILIGLGMSFKIYNMYKETRQKRFAFFIPFLLIAIIFELIDIFKIFNDKSIEILTIFLNSSYLSIGLIGMLFIKNNPRDEKITLKEYIIYFSGLMILFIFEYIMFFNNLTQEFFSILINYATTFIFISILFTFILIKLLQQKNFLNSFNLGLLFLSLSSIYIINPTHYASLYYHLIHIFHLLGITLILYGIDALKENFQEYRMRLKLLLLPNLYMLLIFILFIIFNHFLFNLNFSNELYLSFIIFYILYLITQAIFISETISPITGITKNLTEFEPNKKPVLINIYNNDEIGLLAENINKVSERQWKYTQEIKEKQIQIEDLMKSRDAFIAALSHDLKSPLFAEQKFIESILLDRDKIKVADFIEYLEDMYKINDEVLRIVNNLLTAYHLDSKALELNCENNDINLLIKNCKNTLKHLAKDQNIVLELDLMENIPFTCIDKDMLSRVITNLVSNAIKHSKSAGKIKISTLKIEENIQVSIQDYGKGIPEDEKPNIFQKYPSSKCTIGTGLGLYISKQIIDAHKGEIWFESEAEKGTTFHFTLPIEKLTKKL